MSLATTPQLVDLLRRLRLLTAEQLAALPATADPRTLAKDLVHRGWLTPYQVNELFLGRGDALLLGSYVLLDKLGEGGMGAVFQARNWKLGQIVALKLIRKERLTGLDAVRRFQREIRAAAHLDHPNVVRALDADEVNGTHLLVMEFVAGTDLARIVKSQGPLAVAEACDVVRQAALGLQHAHEKGLVHRDIKPSNLLRTASGVVKVLDFGLALLQHGGGRDESSTGLTQEGAIMGTPDYIAPEQALGAHNADTRSDLYSIGGSLYFLLTGKVPFPGGTLANKLYRHQLEEPIPVERLRPDVPPGVAAIVRGLMAKRPEDRFQKPIELADALATVLRGGSITATPRPATPTASPFVGLDWDETAPAAQVSTLPPAAPPKRRPPLLLIGGGAGVVLLGGLWLAWQLLLRPAPQTVAATSTQSTSRSPTPQETEAKRNAEAEDALKPVAAKAAARGTTFADFSREVAAFRATFGGTPAAVRAAEMLMKLPSPLDQLDAAKIPDDAKAHWKATGFDGKDVVAVLGEHRGRQGGEVRGLARSPDGKTLATGAASGILRLWDAATLHERLAIRTGAANVFDFTFSPDSSKVIAGGDDGVIRMWDCASGKETAQFKGHVGSIRVIVSRDGRTLLSGAADKTVRLWDVESGKELKRLEGHEVAVNWVALSPDGKSAASCAYDQTIRVWDLDGGKETLRIDKHAHKIVQTVQFTPTGDRLISTSNDGTARLWDAKTGAELRRFEGHQGPVHRLALSSDGSRALTSSTDRTIRLWGIETGRELKRFEGHTALTDGVAFSTDDRRVYSGGNDGTVRLWDIETGREVNPSQPPCEFPIAFSPEAATLACSNWADRTLQLWDVAAPAPRLRSVLKGHDSNPGDLTFSPDGATLASSDWDVGAAVRLWDVASGTQTRTLLGHIGNGKSVDFRPDGKELISAFRDNTARLWDPTTGQPGQILVHPGPLNCAAFSPDGRLAVTSDMQGMIRLWNLGTGRELKAIATGPTQVRGVVFHPDGRSFASLDSAGVVRLWDTVSGKEIRKLEGLAASETWYLCYGPDGRTLAASGTSGAVVVWDADTGAVNHRWQFAASVGEASLAPDGRHLAVTHGNGTIYVLRLAPPPER